MKNKHITLLLLSGVVILVGLFMIKNWITENSARQDQKSKSTTTQESTPK